MVMKKTVSRILIVVMIVSLLLQSVGCSKTEPNTSDDNNSQISSTPTQGSDIGDPSAPDNSDSSTENSSSGTVSNKPSPGTPGAG